jgi:hypothetical protein
LQNYAFKVDLKINLLERRKKRRRRQKIYKNAHTPE